MILTTSQVAEAFSRHDFETAFPFLDELIQWNMVGVELVMGKPKVIETCLQSSSYLETVQTHISKFTVYAHDQRVIVESICEYLDQDHQVSKVASCDIYYFNEGQLKEITSYCIEL